MISQATCPRSSLEDGGRVSSLLQSFLLPCQKGKDDLSGCAACPDPLWQTRSTGRCGIANVPTPENRQSSSSARICYLDKLSIGLTARD